MIVRYGDGKTDYGPGVAIDLDGDEVAMAILTYLMAHDVHISGPRTVRVNGELCKTGHVYVDPSGYVVHQGDRLNGGVEVALRERP